MHNPGINTTRWRSFNPRLSSRIAETASSRGIVPPVGRVFDCQTQRACWNDENADTASTSSQQNPATSRTRPMRLMVSGLSSRIRRGNQLLPNSNFQRWPRRRQALVVTGSLGFPRSIQGTDPGAKTTTPSHTAPRHRDLRYRSPDMQTANRRNSGATDDGGSLEMPTTPELLRQ